MKKIENIIEKTAYDLTLKANTVLRKDVLSLLNKAYKKESKKQSKDILKVIIENSKIAERKKIAICQDTGLPIVFVEVGSDIKFSKKIIDQINKGVEKAYRECGFRKSAVDCISGKQQFNPEIVHLDFVNRKGLKITVFPKGFGSENKSQLKMFNPTAEKKEIIDFVVQAVKEAGPNACPPFIVGVGIGKTSDGALLLAKEALLGDVTKNNKNKKLNSLEKEILKKINALNLGPMGLGGKSTALAVKIKSGLTHIAGLPVAVNISCHALRSAMAKLASSEL